MMGWLAFLAAAQAADFDDVLRRWRGDDPVAREAASREVVRRWKDWTATDLERLAAAARDPEGEVAARAGAARFEILRRRKFGESLWPKIEKADALLESLKAGTERSRLMGWSMPGGPMFRGSATTSELWALGPEIEPYLRPQLSDPAISSEIALVLAGTGGVDSLPALIAAIPPKDGFEYTCVVYALWRLTNQSIGIHSRMEVGWSPDVQDRWLRWYEGRKDYLYGEAGSVSLDVEAWTLGIPTGEYRKEHPWIPHEAIREPRDGPEYERQLREFAVSRLLRSVWRYENFDTDVLRMLSEVDDPRSLATIRRLAGEPAEPGLRLASIAWALRRKAPGTIPDLERLLETAEAEDARFVRYPLAWAKLDRRLGPGRLGRGVESDQALLLLECLEDGKRIPDLIARLQVRAPDDGLIRIAGFVDHEGVASALRSIRDSAEGDPLRRVQAASVLGRRGDPASIEFLNVGLAHDKPQVRLEAAEGLWKLGSREGLPMLLALLGLRPLEDGRKGSTGVRTFVPPDPASNLGVVRRACELLGEMGDPSAIEPLRKLRSENLNGFLGRGAGATGTGWYGRPDIVALAKLGEFSGMDVLLESARNGDPLGVAGDSGRDGDLLEIGLKRYAPALVPMLALSGHEMKDLYAARAIVRLLDRGR